MTHRLQEALEKARKSGQPLRIYLACPYSVSSTGHNRKWEFVRFECANIAAARLMKLGHIVFSPISHSVPISHTVEPHENTHEFWLSQDFPMLALCDVLVILTLPGWCDSVGVNSEFHQANKLGKPIFYLDIDTIFDLEREECDEQETYVH